MHKQEQQQQLREASAKNQKDGSMNMFDSNFFNLQQGWRLVVAVYSQAQTELVLGRKEATDSTHTPQQISTLSQLACAVAAKLQFSLSHCTDNVFL